MFRKYEIPRHARDDRWESCRAAARRRAVLIVGRPLSERIGIFDADRRLVGRDLESRRLVWTHSARDSSTALGMTGVAPSLIHSSTSSRRDSSTALGMTDHRNGRAIWP